MTVSAFEDRFWTSRDGLKLHYRDYPGSGAKPAVLCLPGLTRNARDFEALAAALAGERRVICPDLRGRGDSDYARDAATYNPAQYADDLGGLFDQAGLGPVVAIGTSLGGLVTMITAMIAPDRLAGVVLNDVGPVLETDGLDRIRDYVGQPRSFPTWMHAARAIAETQGAAFPHFAIADWLVMAKRCMVVGNNGRIVFDYDMKIAEPLAAPPPAETPDLWPMFMALAGRPVLVLRGELSDVLSPETLAEMARRLPGCETAIVPGVGHAPTLDEPEALAAIRRLLARF